MCPARGPSGSCRHREGKGHSWQKGGSRRKATGHMYSLPHCLGSAGAPEPLQQLSLAGLTSASARNTLLLEGDDRVFPVEISKHNRDNLCYSHITRSQTDLSVSSHQKNQAVTRFCCTALFLFSQLKIATLLMRAGEIDLIWFCFD